LEIIDEIYWRYAGLTAEDLKALDEDAPDTLTQWVTNWLAANPNGTPDQILDAAMDRKYAANPNETFFTGGGEHHFANFEHVEDAKLYDLREAFKESVNLVFVRLLRDIVNYTIEQGPQSKQDLLDDTDVAARREYLERFADQEGSVFLGR